MSMRLTTDIYETARHRMACREVVTEAAVDEFTVESRALEYCLGDLARDETWSHVLQPMRRARWLLHTIPLASDDAALGLAELSTQFNGRVSAMLIGASDETAFRIESARSALALVSSERFDALRLVCLELLEVGADSRATVLLLNQSFALPVETMLRRHGVPFSQVLTPHQLRALEAHASQVVVGVSRHFPDWVFNAPRAETVTVLHRASAADRSVVPMSLGGDSSGVRIRGQAARGLASSEYVFEPPPVDWASLDVPADANQVDSVKARAFLLVGHRSVFLEASDNATVFVVEPDLPGSEIIGRVPTSGVEPGDFLLLRETFADEDLTAQIANQLLKNRAAPLRAQQERWKAALRRQVEIDGVARAHQQLEALGCVARNLGRWLGPDAIRTRSITDFRAICVYSGIPEADVGRIWGAMGEIHSAHMKAGARVRELLEARLLASDLGVLRASGYLRVELDDADAGALGVFRVEARNPVTTMVHPRSLRVATTAKAS